VGVGGGIASWFTSKLKVFQGGPAEEEEEGGGGGSVQGASARVNATDGVGAPPPQPVVGLGGDEGGGALGVRTSGTQVGGEEGGGGGEGGEAVALEGGAVPPPPSFEEGNWGTWLDRKVEGLVQICSQKYFFFLRGIGGLYKYIYTCADI
jgi:hypothetical protein